MSGRTAAARLPRPRTGGGAAGGRWKDWPEEQKKALLARTQARIADLRYATWHPYPWQRLHAHPPGRPPGPCDESCRTLPGADPPAHGTWLLLGGRGTGKTDGGARYVLAHVRGPACDPRLPGGHRVAIVAPTLGDAVESCVNGPSGLRAHDPRVKVHGGAGGMHVRFPDTGRGSAEAKVFGAYTPEDIERLRSGGNRCLVWMEEAAAMRHLGPALEHTGLGLRLGERPHYVMTTTPKPRKELREVMADPSTVTLTGRTSEAHHLPAEVRRRLYEKHRGTRLERQELEGVLIDDVAGALWSWRTLDRHRVPVAPTGLRIVIAVDPAVSNTEASDETGIVVVGAVDDHAYVLDDLSDRYDPEQWAAVVLDAVTTWDADYVVVERNQGGDMVKATIRSAAKASGRPVPPVKDVTARKGKRLRAEPVSVLYAGGRVHHVGGLVELETQLTTWTPDDKDSPDRLDALVYGVTDLLVAAKKSGFAGAA